jgi:hypothetical protein
MDYSTVNGSGRIVMAEKEAEPEQTDPTVPTTKPDIGDNAPTGDFSIVAYTLLALSSACSMGLIIGKKKF